MAPGMHDVYDDVDADVYDDVPDVMDKDEYERTYHPESYWMPAMYREAAIKADLANERRDASALLGKIPKFDGVTHSEIAVWWQAFGPAIQKANMDSATLRIKLPTLFMGAPLAIVMEYISSTPTITLSAFEAHLRNCVATSHLDPVQAKQQLYSITQAGRSIEMYARDHQALHHHLTPHYYYSVEQEASLEGAELQSFYTQKQLHQSQVEMDKVLAFHKGLDEGYRFKLEDCNPPWVEWSYAELKRKCLKLETTYTSLSKRPYAAAMFPSTPAADATTLVPRHKYPTKEAYLEAKAAKSAAKRQAYVEKQQQAARLTAKRPAPAPVKPAAVGRPCAKCQSTDHSGPWSPQCPFHVPGYVSNRQRSGGDRQSGGQGVGGSGQGSGGDRQAAPSAAPHQHSGGQQDRGHSSGGPHKRGKPHHRR